jgi:hypothetical protein
MKRTREITWVDNETGETVGTYPPKQDASDNYVCPKCGKSTRYEEGQIDQLENGWDIHGWWFCCWDCHISSEPVEGTWSNDYD